MGLVAIAHFENDGTGKLLRGDEHVDHRLARAIEAAHDGEQVLRGDIVHDLDQGVVALGIGDARQGRFGALEIAGENEL